MPTLIRLIVILLVLGAIGYGAMFGLVAFVEPREKDVTIRIPARDLVASPQRDPLVRREIDTTRDTSPPEAPATPAASPETPAASEAPAEGEGENGDIVTLQPGTE